jgi:hypothetical protein
MYHNPWDIEVHAKELRERRMRHAAEMRQLDEAVRDRPIETTGIVDRISAAVASAARVFSRAARADLVRRRARQCENGARTLPNTRSNAPDADAVRRRHQPGPFADMVVIARGGTTRNPKQVKH